MRCATSVINPLSAAPAKGSEMSSTTKIAMIFGTKTSVISWICVSAWSRPIARPTTSDVSMTGVMTSSSTIMDARAKSIESAGVKNAPLGELLTRDETGMNRRSDRHVHDALIGLHDFVANGDDRIQRDLGRVHGVDDVDDIGLSRELARCHRFAALESANTVLDRIGEEIPEASAGSG